MEIEMYQLKTAAKKLDVSYQWLDRKARTGKVKFIWLGGQRMITIDEINRIKKEGVA